MDLAGCGRLYYRLCEPGSGEAALIRQTDPCTKTLDHGKIKSALCVRTRRPGDQLVLDEAGHSKSVKAIMRDDKLDVALRDRVPLLAEEDGSRVYWIPALGRTDALVRARSGSGLHLSLRLELK